MTLLNPLVITGGLIKELPSGDLLPAGSLLEAFRAPVYFGDIDSAPLGWITTDGSNTNEAVPGTACLMQTFVNEDDTAKGQVAYAINNTVNLRYWLGGSWSSWVSFLAGSEVIDSIADSDMTHAPSRNAVFDALVLKADIASPTFTGTPSAPTASGGTNTTQLATTAFVKASIDSIIASAPGALDTLNELAIALGNDANFSSTMTTALAGKAPSVLTGYTSGAGTVAATDTVLQAIQKLNGNDALKAPLASPTFTGTVETPAIKITTGAGAKKKFVSDSSGNGSWVDDVDGLQWWQTFTLHAVGVGQQDLPIWIPYDCTMTKIRYRAKSMGTGGTPLTQLQTSSAASTGVISGTSFAPATSPSWNTVSINLSADDLLYAYSTAINTTTVGSQLKVEILVTRR